MIFGVLKDIKVGESRTICTPLQVASIVAAGHTVLVQSGAGVGAGFEDEKYVKAGATIIDTAEEMWSKCDFVAKVKEIEESEYTEDILGIADRKLDPAPPATVTRSNKFYKEVKL